MTFDEIRHTWTSCKGESFIKKVAISQKGGLIGSEVNYVQELHRMVLEWHH